MAVQRNFLNNVDYIAEKRVSTMTSKILSTYYDMQTLDSQYFNKLL